MMQELAVHYDSLTPSEKRVLHYVLDHTNTVIKMTSQAIADNCNVSKTVLITMAQKLGFEGFNDLKFYLKVNTRKPDPKEHANIEDVLIDNVQRTIRLNSKEALEMVAYEIASSKTVYLIARGSSKPIASYLGHMLLSMNIKCIVNPDFNLLSIIAKGMEKRELMIALSLSGSTKIIIDTAKSVKMHGNKLISITSFTNNELANLSDYNVYCVSDKVDTKTDDIISRISMFTTCELILAQVKKCLDEHIHFQ